MSQKDLPLDRLWNSVEKTDKCWLWIGSLAPNGYGYFSSKIHRVQSAHRAAWILSNGPIPPGVHVLHRCDVKRCVRPDHLFLGSALDNMRDKVAKGRQARGERNAGGGKLTSQGVSTIRRRREGGETLVSIAKDFGISHVMVSKIVRRLSWGHV